MSEHTPGPYSFGKTGPEQRMILGGKNGAYVCSIQIRQTGGGAIAACMEGERQANAAFILKALNSHADMLAALKELRRKWQCDEWVTDQDKMAALVEEAIDKATETNG